MTYVPNNNPPSFDQIGASMEGKFIDFIMIFVGFTPVNFFDDFSLSDEDQTSDDMY